MCIRDSLYGDLFCEENMGELPEGKTYDDYLNPDSVQVLPLSLIHI